MTTRVGINGFGRIGRQTLKAIIERAPDLEVVAVNDLIDTAMNALLFKHDSTYGAYPGTVTHTDDAIIVDGRVVKVLQVASPADLPWGDLGVDIVIESTGRFDVIVVETAGAGQTDVAIAGLVDTVVLLTVPGLLVTADQITTAAVATAVAMIVS